jgi:hypothetical protein
MINMACSRVHAYNPRHMPTRLLSSTFAPSVQLPDCGSVEPGMVVRTYPIHPDPDDDDEPHPWTINKFPENVASVRGQNARLEVSAAEFRHHVLMRMTGEDDSAAMQARRLHIDASLHPPLAISQRTHWDSINNLVLSKPPLASMPSEWVLSDVSANYYLQPYQTVVHETEQWPASASKDHDAEIYHILDTIDVTEFSKWLNRYCASRRDPGVIGEVLWYMNRYWGYGLDYQLDKLGGNPHYESAFGESPGECKWMCVKGALTFDRDPASNSLRWAEIARTAYTEHVFDRKRGEKVEELLREPLESSLDNVRSGIERNDKSFRRSVAEAERLGYHPRGTDALEFFRAKRWPLSGQQHLLKDYGSELQGGTWVWAEGEGGFSSGPGDNIVDNFGTFIIDLSGLHMNV